MTAPTAAAGRVPLGAPHHRHHRRRLPVLLGALLVVVAVHTAVRIGSGDPAMGLQPVAVPGGQPTGDVDTASVEPRLLGDPAVRWVGTFDGEPWDDAWGFNWGEDGSAVVAAVPDIARHGRVLDVSFNPDDVSDRGSLSARMGVNRLGAFPLMGLPSLEEAWFRYYVYLPADWEAAGDGKMPGLAGNVDVLASPATTSGGGAYEPGSWSGRVMWNNDEFDLDPARVTPRTYLYVASIGAESIEEHRDGNGRIYGFGTRWSHAGQPVYLELGAWNMIEVHYRMNTPGVADGVFEGFLYNANYPDGVRGAHYEDVQYRDADHPDLAINQLQQSHYYGGSEGPDSEQHMYFDDFVISEAPIGPRRDDW